MLKLFNRNIQNKLIRYEGAYHEIVQVWALESDIPSLQVRKPLSLIPYLYNRDKGKSLLCIS